MTDLIPVADTLDELSKLIRGQTAPAKDLVSMAVSLIAPFIEMREGDRLKAYQDSGGHWTIGIGHTPAYEGQVITQEQERILFAMDLAMFANGVLPLLTAIPGVGQYAALISLAFNIGLGAFKASTVLRQHNAGNKQAAADAFLLFDKEHRDGVLVESHGLLLRRKAEREMYLS